MGHYWIQGVQSRHPPLVQRLLRSPLDLSLEATVKNLMKRTLDFLGTGLGKILALALAVFLTAILMAACTALTTSLEDSTEPNAEPTIVISEPGS